MIHHKHYLDGYPLCGVLVGEFEASRDPEEVTCPECTKEIADWRLDFTLISGKQ